MEFNEFVREVHTSAAPPPRPSRPTWIAILQVCRRWRAIATHCKDFWTYVPLQASAYWVETSLALSYPLPISFVVDFSSAQPNWYRHAALSALRAISRAREVHFQGSAAATDLEFGGEVLRLLVVSSAPMLEAFSVRGYTRHDLVMLPGNFHLFQDAAALHSLTLMLCHVHLSSPLFQAPLVSLHLMDCHVKSPLDILRLLPHLRTLVLENIYGVDCHSSDVLRLPQLQHLELTNLSPIIAFLLQGILVPSSSSVSIMCTDYVDRDDPLDDLTLLHTITSSISPALSAYLERAVGDGFMFPLLEVASPVSAAKKTLVLLDHPPSPDARARQLRLSLVWAGTPKSTNLFSELLSTLPTTALQHVHTLRLRDTIIPTLLSPSSRAADARSRPSPFVAAFHDKARDEAARGLLAILTQEELLPALRRISLQGVDFKHLDPDSLARVLVHRHRATAIYGAKIKLCLQNCLVSTGTIHGLRDCLGSGAVEVD